MKSIIVLDGTTFATGPEYDNYDSLSWEHCWQEPGEVKLSIGMKANNAAVLQRGQILRNGSAEAIITRIKPSLKNTATGAETLAVTAKGLAFILSRDVIQPPSGQEFFSLSGPAETVMKTYVAHVFGSAIDIAPDLGRGMDVSHQACYDNLLAKVQEIAVESGLGFTVYTKSNGKFEFEVLEGVDRTNAVKFSPEMGNIETQDYEENDESYRNVAIVAGKGEGAARPVVTVGTATGLNRRAVYVDARDLTTTEDLTKRGQQELEKYALSQSFDNKIIDMDGQRFGEDWNVGDAVTARNVSWGISMAAQVTRVSEEIAAAKYDLRAVFGSTPVRMTDAVRTATAPAVRMTRLANPASTATGVTDHGALTGLGDDDHSQYHNNSRGDARYVPLTRTVNGKALSANISITKSDVELGNVTNDAQLPANMPETTAAVGQLKQSDERLLHTYMPGVETFNTFLGRGAGNYTIADDGENSPNYNTGIGKRALSSLTSGGANTALGSQALKSNTAGAKNTAVGEGAIELNETGNSNTAIGRKALYSNSTGSANTAVGLSSLFNNNGSENTAVGREALYANTEGVENTAVGDLSQQQTTTGARNTSIGADSLNSNTEGSDNTALGRGAMFYNTTGFENVAVGRRAGSKLTTGSKNVFLGHQSGYDVLQNVDAINSIAIGSDTYTTDDNQVVIGNEDVTEFLFAGVLLTKAQLGALAVTGGVDGWFPADAMTYVSPTTVTVNGDQTGKYQKWDKIELTQTTVKYFRIVEDPTYNSGTEKTTLTLSGMTMYTLAEAEISSPYYSRYDRPLGFPTGVVDLWTTGTTATGVITLAEVFTHYKFIILQVAIASSTSRNIKFVVETSTFAGGSTLCSFVHTDGNTYSARLVDSSGNIDVNGIKSGTLVVAVRGII